MCHYLFSLIASPVALPTSPSLITSLVWSMLNMADLWKMLLLQLSAGIHYSPHSSHRALSAASGAARCTEPRGTSAPLQPRRCAAAASRCRPLALLPVAAGQRPRAAESALWRPRPPQSRGDPPPGAEEHGRLRRGRPGRAGSPRGEEGTKGAESRGGPVLSEVPAGARSPHWEKRALPSSALEGANSSALRGSVPPPGRSQLSQPVYLPSFVWGAQGGIWGLVFPTHFFVCFVFLSLPSWPFSLLCPTCLEWDADEGSPREVPSCAAGCDTCCVCHLCIVLVGPHALSLQFVAGFAFCVWCECWNKKGFQRVPLELTFQACSGLYINLNPGKRLFQIKCPYPILCLIIWVLLFCSSDIFFPRSQRQKCNWFISSILTEIFSLFLIWLDLCLDFFSIGRTHEASRMGPVPPFSSWVSKRRCGPLSETLDTVRDFVWREDW